MQALRKIVVLYQVADHGSATSRRQDGVRSCSARGHDILSARARGAMRARSSPLHLVPDDQQSPSFLFADHATLAALADAIALAVPPSHPVPIATVETKSALDPLNNIHNPSPYPTPPYTMRNRCVIDLPELFLKRDTNRLALSFQKEIKFNTFCRTCTSIRWNSREVVLVSGVPAVCLPRFTTAGSIPPAAPFVVPRLAIGGTIDRHDCMTARSAR
jgi:hypothetical protein